MKAFKACALVVVAACHQSLGQGATCLVDEQCARGLSCLRAVCLRDSELAFAWSPAGATVPVGAIVHMEAKVLHPHLRNGDVQLAVEGAAALSPTEITVGASSVLVRSVELRRMAFFEVAPFTLAPLEGTFVPVETASETRRFWIEPDRIRYEDRDGSTGNFTAAVASAIAYSGGRLFVGTATEWLVFDATTGEQLWSRSAEFVVKTASFADDDSVWASSGSAVHRVYLDGLGSIRFLTEGVTDGSLLASRADGSLAIYEPNAATLLYFAPSPK